MAAAFPDLQMWITLGLVLATMVVLSLERVPLEVTGVSLIGVLMVVFHFLPVIDAAGGNRLDAIRLLSGSQGDGTTQFHSRVALPPPRRTPAVVFQTLAGLRL